MLISRRLMQPVNVLRGDQESTEALFLFPARQNTMRCIRLGRCCLAPEVVDEIPNCVRVAGQPGGTQHRRQVGPFVIKSFGSTEGGQAAFRRYPRAGDYEERFRIGENPGSLSNGSVHRAITIQILSEPVNVDQG